MARTGLAFVICFIFVGAEPQWATGVLNGQQLVRQASHWWENGCLTAATWFFGSYQSRTQLLAPDIAAPIGPPQLQRQAKPRDFVARGIYVSASMAGSKKMLPLADRLVAAGGNTVVFDIKDRDGALSYPSSVPAAKALKASKLASIRRPGELIDALHRRQLHLVARVTCFYDAWAAKRRPDWMPRSRKSGEPWLQKGKAGWLDPSHPAVQDYLLELIVEVADMGVDEIQLDYIRFPTEGDVADASYRFEERGQAKKKVVSAFLRRVRARLVQRGVLLSADIFGVVAWGRKPDMRITGQHLDEMLPHLDVVSPMLYPSHFYGASFGAISQPHKKPYRILREGCARLSRLASRHQVTVRPWLQSFTYRVPNFDPSYVVAQMEGAAAGDALGWLLWNPASRYTMGLEAVATHTGGPMEQVPLPAEFALDDGDQAEE